VREPGYNREGKQKPAKQESMNMRFLNSEGFGGTAGVPRSTSLLCSLRSALSQTESKELTYQRLTQITGQPRSTLFRWMHGESEPSPETLLLLMERLDASQRHQILDRHCRIFPSLHHPWLSHDLAALGNLRAVLSKNSGLTLVCGPEMQVTFLMSAIGHSLQSRPGLRKVGGVDSHVANWFVPVAGVAYPANPLDPASFRNQVLPLLKEAAPRSTLLINSGSHPLNHRIQVLKTAEKAHIILAQTVSAYREGNERLPTIHKVVVSRCPTHPQWIDLQVGLA
jgi:hypothetical protein